jgi:hypothetical protein
MYMSSTNASPIYLILFISATYFLNRPCVYCSLLLAILVISLFDFHSNWFDPRYSSPSNITCASGGDDAMSTARNAALETLSIVTSALNSTASTLVESVVGELSHRQVSNASVNNAMLEWIKSVFRKEWRIDCLDVAIRL